jgi:hypothetical protein
MPKKFIFDDDVIEEPAEFDSIDDAERHIRWLAELMIGSESYGVRLIELSMHSPGRASRLHREFYSAVEDGSLSDLIRTHNALWEDSPSWRLSEHET